MLLLLILSSTLCYASFFSSSTGSGKMTRTLLTTTFIHRHHQHPQRQQYNHRRRRQHYTNLLVLYSTNQQEPEPNQQQQDYNSHGHDDDINDYRNDNADVIEIIERVKLLYQKGRYLRVTNSNSGQHDNDIAQSYYKEILSTISSSTSSVSSLHRLAELQIGATSSKSHERIIQVTPLDDDRRTSTKEETLRRLSEILTKCNYNPKSISQLVLGEEKYSSNTVCCDRLCNAPLYLKPISLSTTLMESSEGKSFMKIKPLPPLPNTSLECLIQLFLLGICVPKSVLVKCGFSNDDLMEWEQLGMTAFAKEDDGSKEYFDDAPVIPYVHIMPIEIPNSKTVLHVLTDLHPSILSITTFGSNTSNGKGGGSSSVSTTMTSGEEELQQRQRPQNDDGPVMYIGPDSIALIQHSLDYCLRDDGDSDSSRSSSSSSSDNNNNNKNANDNCTKYDIVDIGTGSGIQGLALAAAIKLQQQGQDKGGSNDNSNKNSIINVTCVDINRRALQFTKMNFILNGYPEPKLVLGDIVKDSTGQILNSSPSQSQILHPWEELFGTPTHILSNPPFLPVPPSTYDAEEPLSSSSLSEAEAESASANSNGSNDDNDNRALSDIQKRHGYFSSGGSRGDDVLRKVIQLASKILQPDNGKLAIVSEFMLNGDSDDDEEEDQLLESFKLWWNNDDDGKEQDDDVENANVADSNARAFNTRDDTTNSIGVLYTNEYPLPANVYSYRRADTLLEFEIWNNHLMAENITHVSPGLLFIQKQSRKQSKGRRIRNNNKSGRQQEKNQQNHEKKENDRNSNNIVKLHHLQVPKSNEGSIWTPTNQFAVEYTNKMSKKIFFDNDCGDIDDDYDLEEEKVAK